MKLYATPDSYYPFYFIYPTVVSMSSVEIELSEEQLDEFNEVMENFRIWMDLLDDMYREARRNQK